LQKKKDKIKMRITKEIAEKINTYRIKKMKGSFFIEYSVSIDKLIKFLIKIKNKIKNRKKN